MGPCQLMVQQERQRVAAHQLRVESVPPEPDADAFGKPRNLPRVNPHEVREIFSPLGRGLEEIH